MTMKNTYKQKHQKTGKQMNNNYTNKDIEDQICKWSMYLLESGQVSEQELCQIIGEGLFKRAMGAMGRGFRKVKGWMGDIVAATKEGLHDFFVPNKGAKELHSVLVKLTDAGKKLDDVKLYATINDNTYPVLKFALHNKKNLFFCINSEKKDAQPRTIKDLSEFIQKKISGIKFNHAIENIYCAEVPLNLLNEAKESKLVKYIKKHKLTAKSAKDSKVIEYIKKNIFGGKQSSKFVAKKIEEYFSKSKNAGDAKSKKSTDKGKSSGKKASTSSKSSAISASSGDSPAEESKDDKKKDKKIASKKTASKKTSSSKTKTSSKKKTKSTASSSSTDEEKPATSDEESSSSSSDSSSSEESSHDTSSSGDEKPAEGSSKDSGESKPAEGSSVEGSDKDSTEEPSKDKDGKSTEKPAEGSSEKSDEEKEKELLNSIKLYKCDNKFDKVTVNKDDLNLVFGKSKQQIALDRSQLNKFFN